MRIGVVIPAHNEQQTITACLKAIDSAIARLPPSIDVYPLVVLDACSDNTQALVKAAQIDYLQCDYRCVGRVRNKGVRHVIARGCDWIACTDADSMVERDWLLQQLHHRDKQSADMICGVVTVDDWQHLSAQTKTAYLAHYKDEMGHHHIHGANLSFASTAYDAVGGFASLPCHEDVALVKQFMANAYHVVWSNRVRVRTSSRLQARAREGFAQFLLNLEAKNEP